MSRDLLKPQGFCEKSWDMTRPLPRLAEEIAGYLPSNNLSFRKDAVDKLEILWELFESPGTASPYFTKELFLSFCPGLIMILYSSTLAVQVSWQLKPETAMDMTIHCNFFDLGKRSFATGFV